jgi:pyridoxal phosphate enzyme (YggS family)
MKIVAVSKLQSVDQVLAARASGIVDFGENRVQEAEVKIPQIEPRPVWHLVGHLQTNKANKAARLFDWIQSVDSIRVAEALGHGAAVAERRLGVLIQVNTSGERQKSGCAPDELEAVIEAVMNQPRLTLTGLMTIGPMSQEESATRKAFARAAELRATWRSQLSPGCMDVLSMGMSGDWPWALEHEADWIRVGTAIFGSRPAG